MSSNRELKQILVGVLTCFFISGATGLVYEVLWARMLGLVFGHTVFAITTVLSAFMAGLGLGSFVFGRVADRQRNPLSLYGILEVGIGLTCLLIPVLLSWVERLYRPLSQALEPSFFAFSLAQFAVIFLLLLLPTTLMGGTLPVLSRFFVIDQETLGTRVGLLYALNTFGAVVGTALAGYFLLPSFGMRGTLHLAATLNIGIGLLVMAYAHHLRRLRAVTSGGGPVPSQQVMPGIVRQSFMAPVGLGITLTVVGFGLSGASSMIYEVSWTRALSLVIGSSTYAFTAMLVAFLVGIALGSAAFSRLWGHGRVLPAALGFIELGIGVSAILILPAFGKMPDFLLNVFTVSLAPGFILTVQLLLGIAAMIVPTLFVGASFPCAMQVATRGVDSVGIDVGRVYAVNTLGAILGTVCGGFLLIPTLGVQAAVKVAALLNLSIGVVLVLVSARRLPGWQWASAAVLSVALLGGVLWMPAWNQAVMASGVAIYAPMLQKFAGKVDLAKAFPRRRLLFYQDGLSATVTVGREGDFIFLRVNGKTDASNGVDMHTQLMSAHISLLLHPNPKSMLVIGLGSGVTVGAATQYPLERIDVVEIEPAVVTASRFFSKENRNALQDPRVHLTMADGRNFLLGTPRRYDVIVSEPSNPWIGGIATLFSQEFYEVAKRRLKPGGIMLQWVQGYNMLPSDLKMVVRTFRTAFPATTLWHATGAVDYFLVGQQRERPVDLGRIKAVYHATPSLREDMERVGLHSPYALLADFLLTEEDTARYAENADVNTDDLLPLEFSAPRSLYLDTTNLNWGVLTSFRTSDFPHLGPGDLQRLDNPTVRYDLGLAYARKGRLAEAAAEFQKALDRDPGHVPSLLELGKVQLRLNLPLKAVNTFQAALAHDPRSADAYFNLSVAHQVQQLPAAALPLALKAVALKPQETTYRAYAAVLLQDQGRFQEATEHYLAALREKPKDVSLLDGLALTYLKMGKVGDAIPVLQEALTYEPDNPLVNHRIGKAYLATNQRAKAVAALTRAIEYDPLLAGAYIDLGDAYTGEGDLMKAMDVLERGLSLDPYQAGASHALSDLYAKVYGPPR